ncbi:Pentatricopeptide repeat-containing protein [Thalictrum thalictroides]|uniref:Pentatricopeptide repeat-containing protein n=1 Tax=Thalictrum thalictroides TaxID=46969 RepID=A0A7J6WEN7_THATH|nr:Pentatricopeptide repeat-containing protein [Thalictrum thalictroides]
MQTSLSALPTPISSSNSISQFISNHPTLLMLEKKCSSMTDLHKLHANLIKTGLIKDHIAASRILSFCATSPFGNINYAYLVFSQIQNPNLFIWNTIIRGFSQSSTPHVALSLFIDMLHSADVRPQRLTYPSLFKAYAQLGLAHDGVQLHGRIIKLGLEFDTFVRNTIIFMYADCGYLIEARTLFDEHTNLDVVAWNSMIMGLAKSGLVDESRRLFDKMPSKSTISWNSMIGGYVRNGRFRDAFDLFRSMQSEEIKPSEFTTVSLLTACARLGAIEQGKWIHAYIKRNRIELNTIVLTAIIDMYCKCGTIEEAYEVFMTAPKKGLSSWNSMIIGLAVNGQCEEAIRLFGRLESSGLRPDDVSFIGVLTACNHSGMINEAKHYFSLMTDIYRIEPNIKHYGCMVDVLSRAGLLQEAEELITKMPVKPDAIIWGSLLSACSKHVNIEMGERAAKRIIELDPSDSGSYILLSNTYASSGRYEDAIDARRSMKEGRVYKEPGCSLIEVNGVVHEFVVGGTLHPQANKIHALLDELSLLLKSGTFLA